MRLLIKRHNEQTNLWPVLAMHADVPSVGWMMRTVMGDPNYRFRGPMELWQTAEVVALHFGMKWFVESLPRMFHVRFPDFPISVPYFGSGIMFTWQPLLGIYPDKVLAGTYVEAFSNGMVFDPCVMEPIPVPVYQKVLNEREGLVVAVVLRDPDLN